MQGEGGLYGDELGSKASFFPLISTWSFKQEYKVEERVEERQNLCHVDGLIVLRKGSKEAYLWVLRLEESSLELRRNYSYLNFLIILHQQSKQRKVELSKPSIPLFPSLFVGWMAIWWCIGVGWILWFHTYLHCFMFMLTSLLISFNNHVDFLTPFLSLFVMVVKGLCMLDLDAWCWSWIPHTPT